MARIEGVHSPNWGGHREGAGRTLINASSAKMRARLMQRVQELDDAGRGPIDVVAEIMLNDSEPTNIRLAAASLMLSHALPKQQAVAVDVRDDRSGLTLDEALKRIDSRMSLLRQLQGQRVIEGESSRADR